MVGTHVTNNRAAHVHQRPPNADGSHRAANDIEHKRPPMWNGGSTLAIKRAVSASRKAVSWPRGGPEGAKRPSGFRHKKIQITARADKSSVVALRT
jgi:hypothetical protein